MVFLADSTWRRGVFWMRFIIDNRDENMYEQTVIDHFTNFFFLSLNVDFSVF